MKKAAPKRAEARGAGRPAMLAAICCMLAACAAAQPDGSFPGRAALIGKSEQELLACAGEPKKKSVSDGDAIWTYHGAAPLFEQSFPGSKASVPCPRHACDAVVTLKDGRVTDVRYHPRPPSLGGCEHCEELFRACR